MTELLQLKDLYDVVMTDVNIITESNKLSGGKLTDILSQKLTPKYKGLKCVYLETDWDHYFQHFLSEIEGLSFTISKNGLNVLVKIKEKGRYLKQRTEKDTEAFYQLVNHGISRENLNRLLRKRTEKLGKHTYQKNPEIQLKEEGEPWGLVYLIQGFI